MENNELDYINGEYPYGIFPINHTKIGQQKLKEKLNKPLEQEPTVSTLDATEQKPNLDIGKLLPLIKMMGNKKSLSQNDMLQLFLPLLTGGNVDITEMLKVLDKPAEPEEALDVTDNKVSISSYKKIEWTLISLYFIILILVTIFNDFIKCYKIFKNSSVFKFSYVKPHQPSNFLYSIN